MIPINTQATLPAPPPTPQCDVPTCTAHRADDSRYCGHHKVRANRLASFADRLGLTLQPGAVVDYAGQEMVCVSTPFKPAGGGLLRILVRPTTNPTSKPIAVYLAFLDPVIPHDTEDPQYMTRAEAIVRTIDIANELVESNQAAWVSCGAHTHFHLGEDE
jgi:hypothetical protein